MKSILFLVGIGVAGYAGFHFEPTLSPTILSALPPASTAPTTPKEEPTPTPEFDYASLTPEQLPEEVTLLTNVGFSDDASGLRMTLEAGATAKVVRLSGTTLVIRIGTTDYITSLPVTDTDLAKRVTAHSSPPPAPELPAIQTPEPATEPTPTPDPEPSTAPSPSAEPDPFETKKPSPNPFPENAPEPSPPPAPEPTPAPTAQPSSQATILATMRASLTSKQIKAFTINEVKSWNAEPQETVEGVTYDVGTVSYEQETVFGLKSMTAKAYISNGRVTRWIWPKSGITIE